MTPDLSPANFATQHWDQGVADDCRRLVRLAIREDLDRGHDWTTLALVPAEAQGAAQIVSRRPGILAGLPALVVAIDEFEADLSLQPLAEEGTALVSGQAVARLFGSARALLTAERTLLNLLGRLCGIATLTHRYAQAIAGTQARIYDTRKTMLGWRRLEKYAVQIGGGCNHRLGLFDAILIKDNHLAFGTQDDPAARYTPAQAVEQALALVDRLAQSGEKQLAVEVEVDTLEQLHQVLPVGPDLVLLDNMSPDLLRQAVAMRDALAPQVVLEASGGVDLSTVAAIAASGVQRISVGALTHSAAWFDVGLDWDAT